MTRILFLSLITFHMTHANPQLTQADAAVQKEADAFLAQYGMTHDQFRLWCQDTSIEAGIKESHDKLVTQDLENKTCISDGPMHATACALFKEFAPERIFIIDDPTIEDNVGVGVHYGTQSCYITLAVVQYQGQLQALKAILRRLYPRIVYQDIFNHELLQCCAWTHSQESREKILQKSMAYKKACEARADAWAASTF